MAANAAPAQPLAASPPARSSTAWAIVTGASSGIGAAIAQEFAARNWNVLLIGRNAELLNEQAALARKRGVLAEILTADLAQSEGRASVRHYIAGQGLTVGALVNNAGFGIHGAFETSSTGDEMAMLDVQLKAALELTKAILPLLRARGGGVILNVASVYAFSPVPNQAVYAACKAFLLSWSKTLALELHGSGITVSVLCPGITHTRFRARAGMKEKKSAFAMSAEAVAAIGVRGALRGTFLVVPGWHNWFYTACARCLPSGVLGRFTLWFNRRRGIAAHPGGHG